MNCSKTQPVFQSYTSKSYLEEKEKDKEKDKKRDREHKDDNTGIVLDKPSEEQQAILTHVSNGLNVVGDCVAGSGKTTSVLLLAQAFPDIKILQITYNSQLKFEVRKKAKMLNIKNIEIHTYHSLCVRYYNRNGHTDDGIRSVLECNQPPITYIPYIDLLILDEAQDMSLLFYGLVKKFKKDNPRHIPQMVVLGDKYQCVYRFQDADPRFLTHCNDIWGREFIPISLNTSYRVTKEIAAFVNDVMLGQKRILAVKRGYKVIYIKCDIFNIQKELANFIQNQLQQPGVVPGDIFVLAGSLKGAEVPVRHLENELVSKRIPCYYPVSDDQILDEEIIEGKVVFSTFGQSKGRERKIVLIYGFDDSYSKFYGREDDPNVCPERLYVGVTRAKTQLILLHHYKNGPLPFLKKHVESDSLPYVSYQELTRINKEREKERLTEAEKEREKVKEKHKTSPTELVKFLKESNIRLLNVIVHALFTEEEPPKYTVKIPSKIEFAAGNHEDVSDINGIAIPAMYETLHRGKSQVEYYVRQEYANICTKNEHLFLREAYHLIGDKIETNEDFVRLTIMYISLKERIYNKIQQITRHNWITDALVEECFVTLRKHVKPTDTRYERPIEYECPLFPEFGTIVFSGFLDTSDAETILELKCTDSLSLEHMLQLVMYAWMWEKVHSDLGPRTFKLVNVRTGQVMLLHPNTQRMEEAVRILLRNKYEKPKEVSDSEFVRVCLTNPITSRYLIVDDE